MDDNFGVRNEHFHQRWSRKVDGVPNVRPAVEWALYKLGRGIRCMEVGVASGVNARAIVDLLKPCTMMLVDANPQCGELVRDYPQSYYDIGDSHEILKKWLPNCIDFAYIDADHSTEAVAEDIRDCLCLVRAGGVLGGDDYDGGDPKSSVDAAVLAIFSHDEVRNEGHDWWVTVTQEMKERAGGNILL